MSGQLKFYSYLGLPVFCIMVGLCMRMSMEAPKKYAPSRPTLLPSVSIPTPSRSTLLDQHRNSANVQSDIQGKVGLT